MHYGLMATLITPSRRSPKSLYASVIWSSENVCIRKWRQV